MNNLKIGHTPLYQLLNLGVKVRGAPLRDEPKNHTALGGSGFQQEESWHSGRSDPTAANIEAAISSDRYSVLIDLATCKAAEIKSDLIRSPAVYNLSESRVNASLIENLVLKVSKMKRTTPGKMVLVVACDCDRTKDSRRIQDKFGAQWSYLGDPSVTVLGLVPGETPFIIERIDMHGDTRLATAMYRMEESSGTYADQLIKELKKTLMTAADPNSNSIQHMLWSNFYSAAEVFALLQCGVEANTIKPGYSIIGYGPNDYIEFSLQIASEGHVEVNLGEKEHYLVPEFFRVLKCFLRGNLLLPQGWDQENAYRWAALFVSLGVEGYYTYRLLVYASFCNQLKMSSGLDARTVLTSRIMDESFGRNRSYSWPRTIPRLEFSNLIEAVFNGMSEVDWFGINVVAEDLSEADEPFFDNDAKGSASRDTLKSTIRVDGIKLSRGHGMPLRSGSDLVRFRLGGQRVQLEIRDGKLKSSVRFQPHRLLDPLVRLRGVDVRNGSLEWGEATENGSYTVSNAMFNQLLAGAGGRKIAMWILARILYEDLPIRATERMACYTIGALVSDDAMYEVDAPLDARILSAMHTYTDGKGLWVDFKDNGDLLKIVRTRGRFCHLSKEDPPNDSHLQECSIRSTLRARDSLFYRSKSLTNAVPKSKN